MSTNWKSSAIRQGDMRARLAAGVDLAALKLRARRGLRGTAVTLDLKWGRRRFTFAAQLQTRTTPRAFEETIRLAQRSATRDVPGMIILPYLNESQLQSLIQRQFSGIDLSGNGVIIVPETIMLYRSGMPNQYREFSSSKFAYRGTTSLVPRVFLLQPKYGKVSDLQSRIRELGGTITLGTVSKALKRMDEDVLVSRRGGQLRVLQPDDVLTKLSESYRPPRITRSLELSLKISLADLYARTAGSPTVLSGEASAERYAVFGRTGPIRIYCRRLEPVAAKWQDWTRENSRFVDIELCETDDPCVYFDIRSDGAIPYASPIQAYLELAAGDKRYREISDQIRDRILKELNERNQDEPS